MSCKSILLSSARCGSALLTHSLSSILRSYGEPFFNEHLFKDSVKEKINRFIACPARDLNLDEISRLANTDFIDSLFEDVDLFKINYWQMERNNLASIIGKYHIIHLSRRSCIEWYLSLYNARLTGIWQNFHHNNYMFEPISLDLNKAECEIRWLKMRHQYYCSLYKEYGCPYLEIYYEDLIGDWDNIIYKIQEFLQLPKTTISKKLNKVILQTPKELIVNYDEFYNRLVHAQLISL